MSKLYRAIQKVFGCRVIVDSSKHPMYAHLLQSVEGIEPYVLHLTRDPRASAYSFLRKRVSNGNLLWVKDLAPFSASLRWTYKHTALELLNRSFRNPRLLLRHEDFVANPQESLRRVLQFVGEPQSALPLREGCALNLDPQHTVSGNPSRFIRGQVELRENYAWKTGLKRPHRALVTVLTSPLLVKYGYPTRAGNHNDSCQRQGNRGTHKAVVSGRS
jgi:hypothetical protein